MTREQSRANTRERLLAAARLAFARGGFHGASVDEIASEAGLSTGALYSNFNGKEDLFLVLLEREIDEHARELALHQHEEQVLLAVEVRVERAGRQPGLGGDLVHRRPMEPAPRECEARRGEQPLARVRAALLACHPRRRRGATRAAGCHGHSHILPAERSLFR